MYVKINAMFLWKAPASTSIIKVMRWAGKVARMGKMRNAYNSSVGKLEGRDNSEDLGVDGKIMLEGEKVWTGFI
jgi:hypothetical protein